MSAPVAAAARQPAIVTDARRDVSFRHLLAIAFPMIVSQGSETIMLFFNRYFVSFLGSDHIPASMSGGLTRSSSSPRSSRASWGT